MTSLFTEWYMGNYIRPLSDAVFTIASDDLWIESLAIQQLHTTANLPNMQRVVGMPDLHPGRGYPIGAAFFSVGRFYPALVGNDIGCGMALWQTDILTRKYNADKFEKRLSDLDDVAEESWLEENLPSAFAQHPWRSSLGSIGGGNHFAELQQVDQIINAELFALAGLDAQHLQLLVHSGSRGGGSLFYSGILPRSRIMVCLKAVTTRYGILRNMTMRWRLRVLIAR
ncbi:RNA ligase RtcB family protein [Escherichia coli]|nr:RNA ligase RtcB family protein [Escherichia coli]